MITFANQTSHMTWETTPVLLTSHLGFSASGQAKWVYWSINPNNQIT